MSLVGARLKEGVERGVFIYHRTSRRRRQTAAEKQSFRRRLVIDENQTDRFATFYATSDKVISVRRVIASSITKQCADKKRIARQCRECREKSM